MIYRVFNVLENLLNIVNSQENYKTILRVVFNRLPKTYLSSLENKEEIAFLWDAIQEISKTRGDCMRSLTAVQFENLKNVINETDPGDTDKAIFTPEESFDKIINLFEVIQELYDTESLGIRGEGFDIAESVWNFIRHSHPTALLKYKAQVKQIIDAICRSQFLVYQLVLAEDVVEKIIHECVTHEKIQIFLHLMKRFFQKMKFNEESMDAELRKRVFLCLRRYCTSINTLFNKDDPADCLMARKIFSFIVRFYIVLIEEEKISNFEDFFNIDIELCHHDSIFNTSRSNDSQMILLAFIQFYDAMLDAGKYEILLDKDIAKVLLKLTSTLLLVSPKLNSVLLERGCYDKLYHILSEAHLRLEFNNEDILAIINILFNLATKGYYHFVVEKPLSFDIARSVEDQMNKIIFSEYSPFWNYIAIKNRYFLSLLLKCLFEWNAAKKVKNFYLAVLESALTNSLANAAVCLQGEVFDRLMLYMKVELDKNNKKRLRDLIYSVLRVGVAVSHVKAFMRAFRYNYWESHEDYFRSLVSEFARANFIKKMSDPDNYYHSFLSSLYILKKVLKNSEDNENFTNFNGEHSGIIISNLNQSLRSTLTFLVTFRVENYISSDKRNIVSNYKILRDKITFEDNFNRNSFVANMEGSVHLNYGYFDNSRNGLLLELRNEKLNRSSIMENNELYYPRLFSMTASHTTLEFYVGIQNRQPCLILDGKHRKRDGTIKEYREYFDFCPKENEWYTMFLIFTGKNTFKAYIANDKSDESIKLINRCSNNTFSHLMDHFGSVQHFCIGTSPPKSTTKLKDFQCSEECNLSVENSFCGQIKRFYLIKKELSDADMENILKKMRTRCNNSDQLQDSTIKTKKRRSLLFGNKPDEAMDLEQFESQALLNLNAFPNLDEIGGEEDDQWASLSKNDAKVTHSIVSIQENIEKMKKAKTSVDRSGDIKHEIRAKGVTHLEKSCFEDVLFRIGNAEIILYILEILNKFEDNSWQPEQRHELLCEVIRLMSVVMCTTSNKDDVMVFFSEKNGFHFMARLIKQYVVKFGISECVIDTLDEFIRNISKPEDRYKGFMALILNFDTWNECSLATQNMVYEKADLIISKDLEIYSHFKKNYDFMTLILQFQKLIKSESLYIPNLQKGLLLYRTAAESIEDGNDDAGKKKLQELQIFREKIKSTVIKVLSTPLDAHLPTKEQKDKLESDQIIEKECEHIVRYIALSQPSPFVLEIFKIILKLLTLENKEVVEAIKEGLQKQELKDVIFSILYTAYRRSDSPNRRRRATSIERVLDNEGIDSLIFHCIEISRILFFSHRLDPNSGKVTQKLDNDSLRKANLLLADFLFGADINLPNEKDEALKVVQSQYLQLYNLCLNDMDPLTYKGLFKTLMQWKQNGKSERIMVFRKDYKMIGLVLEKFIQKKIRPAEGKNFLKDLYAIMRTHYSMKVFLGVPNYLHFLNELLRIQIDEENADEEIRGLIYKIFRRFISFTLFEEELHVFCLISLIEFVLNEKLKESKPLKKEDQLIIHEQSIPNNLDQLFKHIEAAICEFKEQIFKGQAQGDNTDEASLSEKSLEAIHSKKAFVLSFAQFIYYYEYFLIKNHRQLEEQENLICRFTTTLFEFMYDTQILLVTYPSVKHVSGDTNLSTLSKRHENICYRNGGPFLSILTSIFSVLKNTKTVEKIKLLNCCFTILAVLRSKKSLEGDLKVLFSTFANSKHEVQKDKSSQHNESTTKKESVLTVRQAMTPSLIEAQSNDKSPDLLVYKDMLLVYETMFCEILKLMSREIKRILRINRESMEKNDEKIEIKSILTRQESKSTSSNKVCLELSKLLMEVLAVNGVAIKNTIQHYYQMSDLNPSKSGSPVKKSATGGTQKMPLQTELRISNQITPVRMELEGQGEESNDKIFKKQISSLVERVQTNSGQTSLKVNELIGMCQSLFDFDKDHPNVNNRQPKLQGSEDLMQKILVFVEYHHKDLKKEVISTLKNSHLRTIYLIKELNCSYFKLQTDKNFQLMKKSYDEFQADLDPEKSIKFFKEKDANRQQLVIQNRNLVIENFKKNEHLLLRVKSLWIKTKRGLTEERGVWQMETKHSALTRYKYGKIEDELHRRMRLIVDKQAAKIVYKSKDVYEKERLDCKKISNTDMKETSISNRESMQSGPSHQSTIHSPLLSREHSAVTQQSIPESNINITRLLKKAVTMKSENSKSVQFLEEISGSEGEELSVSGSEDEEVKSEQTASKLKKKSASNKIYKCERITIKGAIWGELQITENYFIFSPLPEHRPETALYEFGAIKDNRIMSTKKKNWNLNKIKRIYHRRYMYVKSAFEFFTSENKSYYFNVFNPNDLKTILGTIKSRARDVQIYNAESFDNKLTARWQEGKMSNFEYLMHLNMLAGRSFNDLTQYPVFPWILADYTSEELNLNTKDEKEQKRIFRDLSLPMGALNEEKRRELKTKLLDLTDIDSDNFESVDKEELEKKLKTLLADESIFMYGSHYSAGGHVLGYLVRLEPFTSLQIKLQNGKLEEANRTFASIPKAWDMYFSSHNRQNFKELTPEFFYCPNFLKNK